MLPKCIPFYYLHFDTSLHQTFRDADTNATSSRPAAARSQDRLFASVAYVLELGVTQKHKRWDFLIRLLQLTPVNRLCLTF